MALCVQLDLLWLQHEREKERESLRVLLKSGLTDTFRHQFPGLTGQLGCKERTNLKMLWLSLIELKGDRVQETLTGSRRCQALGQ